MSHDARMWKLEQVLGDVNLQDAEVDSSRSNNEAKEFEEAHSVVKNSKFEIPVLMKTGVQAMPNKLIVAQKRVDSLRKVAIK